MNKIPTFAVVGRTNKGKSSLVATLTENDRVAVAPTPRTTSYAQDFTYKVDGKPLFTIYDTPGFEEAPAILEWLKAVPVAAHERKNRVREFYNTFHGKSEFAYECELLKPILDGAAILYVADASHPFRPNFESEFEILQWTGQPSIALLNRVGTGEHEDEWKLALGQYFKAVRVFDTHTVWIKDRVALIEELRFLSDEFAVPLQEAANAMRRELDERLKKSARIVTQLLKESITYELKVDLDNAKSDQALSEEFLENLRAIETSARKELAKVFGFHELTIVENESLPGFDGDLFSKETWEVLGLKRTQLIAVGTASGAVAGGTLDAFVGGTSFMAGMGIGTVLGGLSSTYFAFTDPSVAGVKLGKKKRTVGPHENPNFPWVLIDRQTVFIASLLKRTHADRGDHNYSQHDGPSSRMDRKNAVTLGAAFLAVKRGLMVSSAMEKIERELYQFLLTLKNPSAATTRSSSES